MLCVTYYSYVFGLKKEHLFVVHNFSEVKLFKQVLCMRYVRTIPPSTTSLAACSENAPHSLKTFVPMLRQTPPIATLAEENYY